jgi:hypothetical protein
MIKAEQIPPEVVEAAAQAMARKEGWLWETLLPERRDLCLVLARAALAAALAAWPWKKNEWRDDITFDGKPVRYSVIILPLKTETPNAK